jgi:antitoxin CcdA
MRMAKDFSDPPRPFRRDEHFVIRHLGDKPKPGPKRATNVSIDAEILAEAKAMKINLSQTLEDELRKQVKTAREAKWREENKDVVESYNRLIERAGVFGEEFQDWE